MSLDAMRDRFEREAVELLNRKRFGGRLTPGPEMILGPQFKVPSDHTLRQWYLVWNKRYGSSRATDIRRGKDLACYNGAPIVLKEEATWNSVDSFDEEHIAWLSVCGSEVWQVQMQPFPTKHLYVLTLNSNPVWEFDDWPVNWKR